MTTATHTKMGYRATREGGKLIVHDVPIFCACERGEFVADERWIAAAVERAKLKAREGYLPPLHTRHHEASTAATDSVRAAGVFRITHSGPITIDGTRRLAIFADLIITDECVQDDVLRMRFPYRSVEIFDVGGQPSIDSLALLDHEAPFLEMPMLLVADVEDHGDASFHEGDLLDLRGGDAAMVGLFRRGARARLLFREGPDMADEKKPEEGDTTAPVQKNFADDGDKKDDKKKEGDKENMEGEGGLDVSAVVKAIESGEISVKDMDAILAAIQNQKTEAKPEEEPEAVAPAAAPGESMGKTKEDLLTFARLQGEIDGLKAKDAERDAAEKRKTDVAVAMKRLEGRPLGADIESKLVAFHKKFGGEAFKDYVDAMAQAVGVLPDQRHTPDFGSNGVPAAAMKFSQHGTAAVDKAASFIRQWEELRRHGLKTSRDNYLRINMERAGFGLGDESA